MGKTQQPVILVGCSSGGKEALDDLIPRVELGRSSIVIVSHIEYRSIYDSLSRLMPSEVRRVRHGATIAEEKVYVACDDNPHEDSSLFLHFLNNRFCLDSYKHVGKSPSSAYVFGSKLGLSRETIRVGGVVDYMFAAGAFAFRERAVGVVLSGAGDDGAQGLTHIKKKGGVTMVQGTPSTFPELYEEMPCVGLERGNADYQGTTRELADRLNYILRG